MCLRICGEEPDLMLITEMIPKAQCLPISPALLAIPGYTLYCNFDLSSPNLGRSGIRGVCVYASNRLRVLEVTMPNTFKSVEHVWVQLSLTGSDCMIIGCVNRSPSSDIEESVQHLDNLSKEVTSMSVSHLMIAGDLNLPEIDWTLESSSASGTNDSHTFLETVQDCLLFQHVRHPTRYRLGETPNLL